MSKGFYTEHEAAEYLGLSHRTLQSWRLREVGPEWRKFGRAVRYPVAGLEDWDGNVS